MDYVMESVKGKNAGRFSGDALEIGGRPCLQYLITEAKGEVPRGERLGGVTLGMRAPLGCPDDWRTN